MGKLKSVAPKGVAEYDSDQEGAAILGGKAGAIIQYTGNAIKSDDPKQSKEVGKLDCSDSYVVKVTGAVVDKAKLDSNRISHAAES